MSINTMANVAIARHAAQAARVQATPGTASSPSTVTPTTSPSAQVNGALTMITTYIPTEILTLYVAVRSALSPATTGSTIALAGQAPSEGLAFIGFFIATPVVAWIVFATKLRAANRPLPLWPSNWPVWEMFASTLAFVAWAFGLPNSVFNSLSWYSPAIAAVVVLVASTVIGLIAPIVTKR